MLRSRGTKHVAVVAAVLVFFGVVIAVSTQLTSPQISTASLYPAAATTRSTLQLESAVLKLQTSVDSLTNLVAARLRQPPSPPVVPSVGRIAPPDLELRPTPVSEPTGLPMQSPEIAHVEPAPCTVQPQPSPLTAGHAGYLVYGAFSASGYTNRKIQLMEAMAMALASNRTLLVPWLCEQEPVTYLFDAARLRERVGVIEDTTIWRHPSEKFEPDVQLDHICGPEGVQVLLPSSFDSRPPQLEVKGNFRGVRWTGVKSQALTVAGSSSRPSRRNQPEAAAVANRHREYPYFEDFNAELAEATILRSNQDSELLLKLTGPSLSGARCLYVDHVFYSFHLGLVADLWPRLHAALLPSVSAERHVNEWMAQRGLEHGNFISVHIRLDDMVPWSEATKACHKDQSRSGVFRDALLTLIRRLGLSNSYKVALATEDFQSPCVKALESEFPGVVHVDLAKAKARSCWAAQHIQEVLGHGAAFVGTGRSSFSASIGWIRKYRYAFPANTTLLLDK